MTSARSGEIELASSLVASAMWEITDDIEIGKWDRPQRHSGWDFIWAHMQIYPTKLGLDLESNIEALPDDGGILLSSFVDEIWTGVKE